MEIDRFHLGPDAAGAAEIGDTRFGGDASAGEKGDAGGGGKFAGERGDGVWALHGRLPGCCIHHGAGGLLVEAWGLYILTARWGKVTNILKC